MYSVKCFLGAVLAAALMCATAHAAVTTGGGSGVNPNAEYDTYVAQAASGSPDTWEISLPNDTYYVTIACGDPSAATGPHLVKLAGDGSTYSTVAALNVATAANTYATATNVSVTVTAGKLSLQLGGNSAANRINFIIISESILPVTSTSTSVSYSNIQDLAHLTYNSYNESTEVFTPLVETGANLYTVNGVNAYASYPKIYVNGAYPGNQGANLGLWCAKTWTATIASTNGPVKIQGWCRRTDPRGSDGCRVLVVKNDAVDTPLWEKTISAADTAEYTFGVDTPVTADIVPNDKIHLMLDPISEGWYDATQMDMIVFDAIRDSALSLSGSFSDTQGSAGIKYEYYSGGSYTNLVNTGANAWSVDGTTSYSKLKMWVNGCWPNSTATQHPVRTWEATKTGTVDINGWAKRTNSGGGDGCAALVYTGNNYASPDLWTSGTIPYNDLNPYTFSITNVAVLGPSDGGPTKIRFHVDPLADGNYDATQMDAVISYQ